MAHVAKDRTYDWGGISLIVADLKIAAKPGLSGTASTLTSTELGFIDGITAGTGLVSKSLVLDANGDVAMPAAGLITGLATELVDDGTTIAVTAAQSGSVFDLDSGAAAAFTLPAAAVGLRYTFVCSITTHAATTITCTEGDFFVGAVIQHDTDTAASEVGTVGDGTADDVFTLNGTTTGGIAGSYVEMLGISATQWLVWGNVLHSGTIADPYTAP